MGSVAEHQAEVLVWEQFRGIPRWLAVLLCVGLTCSYVAAVYVPQFLLSTFRYFWRGPSSSPGLQARARLDRGCDTPAACCSSSSETVQSHTRRLPNSDRQLGCAGRFTHSQRPAVQSPAGRSAGAWRACGVAQPASASSSSRPTRAPLPNEPVEICLVSSACRSVDAGCDLAHGSRRGSPSRRRQPSPLADRTQAPMVSSEEDDRSPLPPGFLGFPPSAELHPHQLLPPRSAEVDGRKREASSSPAGAWGSDGEGHSEGGRRPTESARTRIDGRTSEGASLAGSSGACRVSAGDAGGIEELSDNLVDHLLRDFSAVDCCSGSAVVSRTLALLLHSVGAVGVCLFLCLRLGLTNTGGCEGAAPDGQLHGAGSGTPPEASRSSGGTSHSDAGGLRDSRGANLGLDEPNLRRWAPAGMLSFLLVSFGLPQAEEGADWLSPSLVSLKLLLALYGPSLVVRSVPPLLVAAKRLRSASLCAAASCAPTSVRAPPQPSAPGGGDTHRYKAARPQFCRQSDTARSFLSAPHGQMEGQLLEVEGDRRYQGEAKTGTVMGDVGVSSGSPAQQLVCADGGGSTVVKPMTGKHHQGNKRCEGDSCLLSGGSNDGYKQHTLEIPEGLASLTSDIREGFWPFVRACVVAPVVEEFLFRGVFVALLAGHIGCLGTCAGVSILFALAHIHHFVLSVVADAYEQDLPVPRPLGMNSDEKNCAGLQRPLWPLVMTQANGTPYVHAQKELTTVFRGNVGDFEKEVMKKTERIGLCGEIDAAAPVWGTKHRRAYCF
ncbi:hypothetical protein BESB_003540 [Besnoitia besnoiti]|uniref:intramembrane prenyl-peptidase Rce1 n=1 Tax=Besnoitia besnoiti TaxID=94643 RepID=A0A2A9MPL2_BESBE|nr:hypothetical protein BESB_003540 [Besnoitia besnoiti]PFH38013.1 hypothetical protein BESB_003540 [Besnoitia besnoiti]